MGTSTSKAKEPLYLAVSEKREHGYFHLHARVRTAKYEHGQREAWGIDGDDYGDGLLYGGLEARCQGDDRSQLRAGGEGPVYGFDVEYHEEYHSVGLRRCRRMLKTLEKVERGMGRLTETRGYVKSFGEFVGRLAEVLGCEGIAMEKDQRAQLRTGERWEWTNIGDGVNRVNHRIYLWAQEAVDRQAQQSGGGEQAAS